MVVVHHALQQDVTQVVPLVLMLALEVQQIKHLQAAQQMDGGMLVLTLRSE